MTIMDPSGADRARLCIPQERIEALGGRSGAFAACVDHYTLRDRFTPNWYVFSDPQSGTETVCYVVEVEAWAVPSLEERAALELRSRGHL